jgi:Tol biopolymer transport system component
VSIPCSRLIVLFVFTTCMRAHATVSEPVAAESPKVFEPGVISGPQHDAAPAFSPDGRTVWFSRSDGENSTILMSQRVDGKWTIPKTAGFSGQWSDMEPALSPDGRFLIFVSNRPVDGAGKPLDGFFMGKRFPGGGGHLWRVDRAGDGWGRPIHLPGGVNNNDSTFAPSVSRDGSLYFMRATADGRKFHLYRARASAGSYLPAELLPFSGGAASDVDPVVAPDESFMVFGSARVPARGMDLFIVFNRAGRWGAPAHLGNVVNEAGSDAEARLSPDGKTLYFSSERVATQAAGQAAADWNNGKYNIWSVSLTPWLPRP